MFIFGQTIFQSRFIQLPQVYTWMPWIALLLLWNISSWVNHLHIIYLLIFFSFQFNVLKIQNIYSCSKRHIQCSLTHLLSGSLRWPLAIGPHPSSLTVFNFNSSWKLNGQLLSYFVQSTSRIKSSGARNGSIRSNCENDYLRVGRIYTWYSYSVGLKPS